MRVSLERIVPEDDGRLTAYVVIRRADGVVVRKTAVQGRNEDEIEAEVRRKIAKFAAANADAERVRSALEARLAAIDSEVTK